MILLGGEPGTEDLQEGKMQTRNWTTGREYEENSLKVISYQGCHKL